MSDLTHETNRIIFNRIGWLSVFGAACSTLYGLNEVLLEGNPLNAIITMPLTLVLSGFGGYMIAKTEK